MGRPDMRGDELGFRTGLQRQFQQVAAVQAQNGPSVRANVPDRFQACGKLVRRLKRRQKNQVVDLARPAAALVD